DKCVGCGRCIGTCNFDAIENLEYSANDILNKKIAEYSKAVLSGKEHFHISFVVNVSPNCDCHAENDAAIIPDVGMFASFDPVALDMACVDAANKQVVIRDSYLGEKEQHTSDHFINTHPETNWEVCIDHAVKLGLGNKEYKLIEI
ncbi:MAG: DUF362 domain-containing protein, partial [Romboutsia timonensis]